MFYVGVETNFVRVIMRLMSIKTIFIIILIVPLVILWAVFQGGKVVTDMTSKTDSYATSTDSETNKVVEEVKVEADVVNKISKKENIMNATLHTNKGDIEIEFSPDVTPNTVENFTKLAKAGFYDGVKFHRVIKGFMIQGGDPLSKDDTKSDYWGTGGPGYSFKDEITASNKNDSGTISMANSGPNTNGSQFFINTKSNNFLDTKHTVFGKVVKGMDIVTIIENTPVGANDRPIDPVIIKSISF